MHGLVILDESGQVIRPSLIWCDQRSQQQVDFVNAKVGREKVLQYTANPVLTGFTLPKLLWVRDEGQRQLYFRFYDPRVLPVFLPTCDAEQRRQVFGPVEKLYCLSDGKLQQFSRDGN